MKKLFLLLFVVFSSWLYGANVYFLNGGSGYVYTNGQSFYSNQDGYAPVSYWIWADPSRYNYGHCGARFQDPNGNWSDWSDLSGSQGTHHCLKAGTWHVQGRVYVYWDIYGYSNYWMYTNFTLYFYVVDNYAPSTPQNFQVSSPLNQNPVLTWNANTEADLSGYRVYKKYTISSGGTMTTSIFTTSTSYTDGDFTANYKTGEDVAEYWVTAEDINSNVSSETTHKIVDGTSHIQWKLSTNSNEKPSDFNLSQNYPNPFNPSTTIRYDIKEKGFVSLVVYDISGREVVTLINEYKDEGYYFINFDSSNLPSGVYIYKLNVNNFVLAKKMTYLK